MTWFGAAGYILVRFAGWPVPLVIAAAIFTGILGAILIALFLAKVLAGERTMDPRDYRLEGTVGRITISIPAGGAGEVVFSKGGVRRSEAARSVAGQAIARETEVVIMRYERGVAAVQPWDELVPPASEPSPLPPLPAAHRRDTTAATQ